jgi:hypothetical protein
MLKTKLLAISLTLLVTSCASIAPSSTTEALSSIIVTNDKFNNSTIIETPLYLSRQGFTDTFPVSLKWKAYYIGSERQFIQLYVSMLRTDWGFYERANGEDGKSLELVKITKNVDYQSSIKMVTVQEEVGLMLSLEYLQKMGNKDFSIKLYGKNDSGDFVVPSSLTKAFIHKISCFEENECT